VPEGVELVQHSIAGIPLYGGDVEAASGVPPVVEAAKDVVAAADGLLLVTPEYNNSIPGPFKNAIDWMSRPPRDITRVFGGKAVGVIGATPGRRGTVNAQTAWLTVFRALGLVPYFGGSLYLAGASGLFDEAGALVDEKSSDLLRAYLEGFARFVADRSQQ
jgi:chromate reductase, NAD(P)H dehydrogenase (quinone)